MYAIWKDICMTNPSCIFFRNLNQILIYNNKQICIDSRLILKDLFCCWLGLSHNWLFVPFVQSALLEGAIFTERYSLFFKNLPVLCFPTFVSDHQYTFIISTGSWITMITGVQYLSTIDSSLQVLIGFIVANLLTFSYPAYIIYHVKNKMETSLW